jgi:hypothetical protein
MLLVRAACRFYRCFQSWLAPNRAPSPSALERAERLATWHDLVAAGLEDTRVAA